MELADGIAWTALGIGAVSMLGLVLLATGLAGFVHHTRRSRALARPKEEQR
jgi:hypothetical protein